MKNIFVLVMEHFSILRELVNLIGIWVWKASTNSFNLFCSKKDYLLVFHNRVRFYNFVDIYKLPSKHHNSLLKIRHISLNKLKQRYKVLEKAKNQ